MCDQPNEDYTNQRIHHLEMIQGVISRYSDCSARMKYLAILIGWTVILGFMIGNVSLLWKISDFFEDKKSAVSFIIDWSGFSSALLTVALIAVTVACFFLDIYYSQKAQKFCKLYDRVNAQPSSQRPDFCMTLPLHIAKTMMAIPKLIKRFYLLLATYYIILIVFAIILWYKVP